MRAHTNNVHVHTRQLNPRPHPENIAYTHTHTRSVLTSLVTPGDNQTPTDSLLHQIEKPIKTTLAQLAPHTVRNCCHNRRRRGVPQAEDSREEVTPSETSGGSAVQSAGGDEMFRVWLPKCDAL